MSIALRWGLDENGQTSAKAGFLYFDAVTAYTQTLNGTVTKHPIALGGNITDHFIRENPRFTLSGIITGVDISTQSYLIQDLDGNSPFNVFEPLDPVSVNSTDQSVLQKLLPDSIGQFLPDTTPEVVVAEGRESYIETIKSYLADLMSGFIYNEFTGGFDPDIQLVQLFEYQDVLLRRIASNLVITSMNFKEDPNSGEALFVDLTFEQVTFAFLKRTTVPKDVVAALTKKASTKNDKGKVDSTPQTGNDNKDSPDDTDPLREARSNG